MAEVETNVNAEVETEVETEQTAETENQDVAKQRAELARLKAALDKATREAGDYKKQLRAKQSAEEIAAEEKRAADEARDAELAELRKRFAVAETSKLVMGFVGDEAVANALAENLYGADDVDGAIDALKRAWIAREKKLRIEYGKIPAPGIGDSDGPTVTKEQLDGMTYTERLAFAQKNPDEYNRLMGR